MDVCFVRTVLRPISQAILEETRLVNTYILAPSHAYPLYCSKHYKRGVPHLQKIHQNCAPQMYVQYATYVVYTLVQVSSPGAERVVKVPSELERFSALPMYVKYRQRVEDGKVEEEEEEILELVGVDEESGSATWKVANVRINREVAGKGRGLTKKQRERRIRVLFGDIMIVRVFVDI